MVWDNGTFEFAIDDLRPIDDIALYPSDVLPDADINTQMVLLEAARIFDERNRDRAEGRGRGRDRLFGRRRDGDPTIRRILDAARRRRRLAGAPRRSPSRRTRAGDGPEARRRAAQAPRRLERPRRSPRSSPRRCSTRSRRWRWRASARPALPEPGEPQPIVLVDLRQSEVSLERGGLAAPRPSPGVVHRPGRSRHLLREGLRGRRARRPAGRGRGGRGLRRERHREPARPDPRRGAAGALALRRRAPAAGLRRPALRPDLGHGGAQPHAHHLGVGGARRALPGQARPPGGARRVRHRRQGPSAGRVDPRPQGST